MMNEGTVMNEASVIQDLFSIVEPSLPTTWNSIIFYFEYYGGSYVNEYYVNNNENPSYLKCFDLPEQDEKRLTNQMRKMNEILAAIRKTLPAEQLWTTMTLILDNTGRFRIDYDYSDLEDDRGEYKETWIKRYLVNEHRNQNSM